MKQPPSSPRKPLFVYLSPEDRAILERLQSRLSKDLAVDFSLSQTIVKLIRDMADYERSK